MPTTDAVDLPSRIVACDGTRPAASVEWLVTNKGYSRDLWVTRFEVGSEIDDNTSGTVTMRNLTFEVNGTSKSAQFGQ